MLIVLGSFVLVSQSVTVEPFSSALTGDVCRRSYSQIFLLHGPWSPVGRLEGGRPSLFSLHWPVRTHLFEAVKRGLCAYETELKTRPDSTGLMIRH